MYVARYLNIETLLKERSVFLLGPRSTGKSTLVKQTLHDQAEVLDLLEPRTLLQLTSNPERLAEIVTRMNKNKSPTDKKVGKKIVVIDEIQKLPTLLDSVHRLIENNGVCFLLMGSSARKLRRSGVNLLGGRAWPRSLFPLTSQEIDNFDLDRYLHRGGLPRVYLGRHPEQDLGAYVMTYMQEEITAESLARNLPSFSRFLRSMALASGEILNYEKIARDCQVATSTVKGYTQIIQDTLLGDLLEPWRNSRKRKAVATPKFYLFDTGVTRVLAEIDSIPRHSELYGKSFEQFIWMELRAWLSYTDKTPRLTFWRSLDGRREVDFLVGDKIAIEVQATQSVDRHDLKGLHALMEEEIVGQKFYLVSHDPIDRTAHGIQIRHWRTFLSDLWKGLII